MVEQDDVARQVLINRPQAVSHPRAQARIPLAKEARVHLEQARAVREAVGVHAADDRHVVKASRQVRIQVGDLVPRLAVPGEPARRAQESPRLADLEKRIAVEHRDRLAIVLGQLGLGVKRINLTDATVHEQDDTCLGLGRKLRRLGGQRRSDG